MSQLSHRALNGTGGNITFQIDTFEEDEIKVYVDGVEKTNGGSDNHDYTIPDYAITGGTVTWVGTSGGNAPTSSNKVRIVRETDVLNQGNTAVEGRATYSAGSSIKAADLNANTKQVLRALQEHNDQKIQTYDIDPDQITTTEIKDETIVNANINNSADISVSKLDHGTARQVLQTNSSGNGVEFTSSVDLPGTFQVRGNAFLDATTNVSGDLTVFNSGTQKFKVTKTTGNTDIEGTLDVAGTTTLAGNLDVAGTTGVAAADVTSGVTKVLVETGNDSQIKHGDADAIRQFINVETGATADQTASDIKTLLASDNLTDAHLAENSVGTSEIKNDAVGADQLANTAVTPTSYGSSTSIPTITVDAQGRITAASGNTVSFDVVADTSPSLGGDLDVEDKKIKTTTTNGAVNIEPNGTGFVGIRGTGTETGTVSFATEDNAKGVKIKSPTAANLPSSYVLTLPVNDGDNGQFLKTDGAGALSWDTVSGGGGGGGTAASNSSVALTESADGNRVDFTMNTTPASAFNLVVSVNGVVQKPNAGTTIAGSAEGYCISGSTLKFATAPANGSSIFVTLFSATVASDRITEGNSNVDIFDDNATSRAVVNLDGAEKFRINEGGQIGLAGANYGTDGQVLTSQGSGAAAQWETIPTQNPNALDNIIEDTTPQLGGNLDVQAFELQTSTSNGSIKLTPNGTGKVEVKGNNNAGAIQLNCENNSHGVTITSPPHSAGAGYTLNLPDSLATQTPVGGVRALGLVVVPGNTSTGTGELGFGTVDSVQVSGISTASNYPVVFSHSANSLSTGSTSASITITPNSSLNFQDDVKLKLGSGTNDLNIYHNASSGSSFIENHTGHLYLDSQTNNIRLISDGSWSNGKMGQFIRDGAVELYFDNVLKLETYADGVSIASKLLVGAGTDGNDSADEITVENTGNAGITIRSGAGNDGSLFFSDGTSGADEYRGYVQYAHNVNKLYLGSNSGLAMTLDDSQNVGIGTHNPSLWNGDANKLVIYEANTNTGMTISSNGNHNCNIFFADSDTDGAPEYAGYIQYSHASEELRLGANAGDRVRIKDGTVTLVGANLVVPNGNGIDFSATADPSGSGTSHTSELLDDYEEGTFQPILKRLMTNGTTETNFYTQGTRQGNYTRIGHRVIITGRIHWSGGSTGSGSLIMTNLPFTVDNTNSGANEVPLNIGYRGGFNYTNVTGYAVPGINRFIITYFDNNGTYAIAPSATATSGSIYFHATYEVA